MYSSGVSLLHAGQTSKAFDCFTEAAQKLHNNPKLWLRMAECCIYSHKCVSYNSIAEITHTHTHTINTERLSFDHIIKIIKR